MGVASNTMLVSGWSVFSPQLIHTAYYTSMRYFSEYWGLGRTLPTWVLQGRGGEEHTEASFKVGCAASRIRPEISILNTLDLEENIQFSPAEVNAVGQHESSRS